MRILKRILRWILISLTVQIIALAYINFIYLPADKSIKATAFEFPEDIAESRHVKIPEDAQDIVVSHDGGYAAYLRGENLEIISTGNGRKSKKVIAPKDLTITFFRWLPDRDMVIYALKPSADEKGFVKLSTYDVDLGIERNYPDIKNLPKGSEVTDIQLSPLTNVVYVKVNVSSSYARIYKFNIMDNLMFVMKADSGIVIKETNYSDNLIYQGNNHKIFYKNGRNGGVKQLPFKAKMRLLSVDLNDNMYAGELGKEGKIIRIYYGKINTAINEWEKVEIDMPADSKQIIVTPTGKIFRLMDGGGRVVCLNDGREFSYNGELLEILDEYLVARDKNVLRLISLKKVIN